MRNRAVWALLVLVLVAGVVTGCSKKGNESDDASIIGQWVVIAAEINGEPAGVPSGWQMDFRADHTRYERFGEPDAEWAYVGTWSLSGNQLKFTWGESVVTYNYSLVNDTMIIAGLQGDDWVERWLLPLD